MQKQRIRLLILAIIMLIVICFILWRAEGEIHQVDRQMPVLGFMNTLNLACHAPVAWFAQLPSSLRHPPGFNDQKIQTL